MCSADAMTTITAPARRGLTARREGRIPSLLLGMLLVLATLGIGAASPAGACACGVVAVPGGSASAEVLAETAVLSRNSETGIETIVMGLDLDESVPGATLLMPTPGVPEVRAGSTSTLREMIAATAPREEIELDLWGKDDRYGNGSGVGAPAPTGSAVEVHSVQRIDDFDVVVLGGDAAGVTAWLGQNGFVLPGAVLQHLEQYAVEGWTFTAVRYAAEADLSDESAPLRFDFPSAQLIYPMRLSQAASRDQEVHLFVIGESTVSRADASAGAQSVERPFLYDPAMLDWIWADETLRELVGVPGPDSGRYTSERPEVTEMIIQGAPETFTTDIVLEDDPDAEWTYPTYTTVRTVEIAGIPVGWLLVASGVIITGLLAALAVMAVLLARSRGRGTGPRGAELKAATARAEAEHEAESR